MDKKKKASVKKPNPFVYYPIVAVVKLLAKIFFRVKIDKSQIKGLKGPFVIVGNHASTLDVVLMASALFPRRINIVAGKDLFSFKVLRPFMKSMGVIGKSPFGLDIASLRKMTETVKIGANLALYPEGKASQDGTNIHYLPPIGKFIKMLGATVIAVNVQGSYCTKHRFQKGFARGKILVRVEKLFGVDELKKATPDEVHSKIVESIKFNDNDYQIDNKIKFKSKKPADNFNFILYKCPICGAEYQMKGYKDILECHNCGNKVRLTEYGQFEKVGDTDQVVYNRIDTWYAYERAEVRKELIESGSGFSFSAPVTLSIFDEDENKHVVRGQGTFLLTTESISYVGTLDGEEVKEVIPIKEMNSISTKRMEAVNFPHGDTLYRLKLDENKYSTKITLYVEELYRIAHGLE